MFWRSVVGKLWATIMALVAIVLLILGTFLLSYIDHTFKNSADVKRLFIYTAIIGFLLTTFFAFFLLSRITRPLVQMKKAADLISQGDYTIRVPVIARDEIGQLAITMNDMAEQLEGTIRDLSLERDRLFNVLRSMTDAVITFDAVGMKLLANPQGDDLLSLWHRMLGSEHTPEAESRIPEPLMSVYHSVLDNGQKMTVKLHVGSGVWSVVMAPLYSRQSVQGAVTVLRDVTEEFRLDKFRRDFVANVSHELRTPLAMMQGYSEALIDDIAGTADERREIAQVIHDETLRMGRLVQDLLDLARMEAGRLDMAREQVHIEALMERVTRKFAVLCKDRGLSLKAVYPEEPVVVEHADEDRLEQVLTNLLDNAIRHSGSGSAVSLEAKRVEWKNGPAVLLTVSDQGRGIPEQDLPYIFERFYKADKARTRGTTGGTGLGLAIVKSIVEAHRGIIEATSKQGEGTTFAITIPLV